MNLCDIAKLYQVILAFYVEFGPERPDLQPDPAYDLLVSSSLEFDNTQKMWKSYPGSDDMVICLIHE